MSEHPILFTGDMVRAILTCAKCGTTTIEIECPKCGSVERRKTQTRRVIKPQPKSNKSQLFYVDHPDEREKCPAGAWINTGDGECFFAKCPHGKVGDTLWVREAYQVRGEDVHNNKLLIAYYQSDSPCVWITLPQGDWDKWRSRTRPFAKTSGRFMYKSLCRIFLEITGIRVEHLQEISEADAKAEGVCCIEEYIEGEQPDVMWFQELWDSINAKRAPWKDNCWVWVVEFRRKSKGNPERQ